MPAHTAEAILPYTEKQLFDLVADIESYPKFIPWCEAARIWEREGDTVLADLVIRFKGVSGKYTSRVLLDEAEHEISVELAQGPFEHLYQGWKFSKVAGGTKVDFDIDFALRSKFLEKIVDLMFYDACDKMMVAFSKRADELYGAS
jgi:coenzyme Q-binding protein COQ10